MHEAADDVAPVLVVGAAIVDDVRRPRLLLAARRTEPPHLAGGWELPGGKVEPGEDPLDALRRELREELGVEVLVGDLLAPDGALDWPLPPSALLRVWLVQVSGGEPEPLEDHDVLRWLPLEEALSVGWLPADVPIVESLLARAEPPAP